MERIDLFDRYIKNQLSEKELSNFDEKLKSDKDFAEEFKIYLLCVDGIIKEAQQDDIEFGHAMKSLSKAELMNIIGKKVEIPSLEENPRAERIVASASIAPFWDEKVKEEESTIQEVERGKKRPFRIKNWVWQVAGCAAVVGLAIFYVAEMERQAKNSLDGAIYDLSDISGGYVRSASGKTIDVQKLDDNELKESLPELIEWYESSETDEEIAERGNILVLAYVRLHERKEAKILLEELIQKFNGNEDFQGDVETWQTILNYIK